MELYMGYLNSLAIAAAPLNLDEKLNWHRFDFDKVIPDEVTFESMTLKSWRVLKEVL